MSEMNKEHETSGKFNAINDNDDNLPDYSAQKANSVISYGSVGGGDGKKKCNGNNNGLSNNEYKMDMKVNGSAEEDPLTGAQQQNWHLISPKSTSNNSGENPKTLKWRQRFASTNFFMVVFLVAYVLQGCYFTYFVSVITTIERLFHIKSASIALLLNFSEVGQICASLILTYFAGRGHRPRWIACGMFLFAIAAFGSVSPHFIYRDRLYNRQQLTTASIQQTFANDSTGGDLMLNLCVAENPFNNKTIFGASSCNADSNNNNNNQGGESKDNDIKSYVLIILAVSLLGIGVGQTAIATLGIPFIDDNVKSKQSPLYMAITIGVRVFGPALGYYLGSICTSISFDFAANVDHKSDPNFIGAWFLGLLLVAITMFFASLVMFTFPKNLRNNKATKVEPAPPTVVSDGKEDEKLEIPQELKLPKYKDFAKTIKRQLKNDILMFRTASAVLHLLPITGLYVFIPKYLETQFNMPPTEANKITGTFGILVMGAGIFVTGVISVKFPLSARKVSLWIAFTALLTTFGMLVLSMLGCHMNNYRGLTESGDGSFGNSLTMNTSCKNLCTCEDAPFAPVCGSDGYNYFSPCHAGCKNSTKINGHMVYSNCECIEDDTLNFKVANEKFCETKDCNKTLYAFIAVFALTVFIHSTSEVGGMLIIMRCTHPKDKAMAMGIVQFSLSLLSNIPCPNIYGRIIDATCILFAKICNKQGHCLFYNSDNFRKLFFGVSCFIMFLAFIMDVIVYLKSHRIDIDGDGGNEAKEIPLEDKGSENLLRMSTNSSNQEADDDQHTKITM